MVRPRRDRAPWSMHRLGLSRLHGPRRDRVKVERPALVRDPPRPVHRLFHQHTGGSDRLMTLIASPLLRDGEILAQAAGRLEAPAPVHIAARRAGARQIGDLGWLNGDALIVDRQITLQKLIRRLQRGDVREPHLLDHPILNGLKAPLHPPLRLGRVGRDPLHPQFAQRPSTLARGRDPCQLLVHGGRDRRLIGGMLVRVDGQRNPLLHHVAREAIHRWDRAFVLVEPGQDPTGRIIDVRHQDAARPPALQPVVVRPIQLHQLPHMGSSFPPRPVRARPPREGCHALCQEPAPQGFVAARDPLALGQLLRRPRRSNISLLFLVQRQRRGLDRLRDPPVRRRPSPPMREPVVACLRHPCEEASEVAGRQPQEGTRLHLRQRLLPRLAKHRHPPECLHPHDDPVLSDHPALRVRAGSLSVQRTFLSWRKRTLSLWVDINLSSHAWYVVSTYAATRAGRASSTACPGKVRASRQARQLIGPAPPPHEW